MTKSLCLLCFLFLSANVNAQSITVLASGNITGMKRYSSHIWVAMENPQILSGDPADCYHSGDVYYFAFKKEDNDLLSMLMTTYVTQMPVKIVGLKEDASGVNREIAGVCSVSTVEI